MDKTPFADENMTAYFNSLPINIQETIRLSAKDIENEEELRAMAEHLMR